MNQYVHTFSLRYVMLSLLIIFVFPECQKISKKEASILAPKLKKASFQDYTLKFIASADTGLIKYSSSLCFILKKTDFGINYSKIEGIFTFRGGPFRNYAGIGRLTEKPDTFFVKWIFKTPYDTHEKIGKYVNWKGGTGWTGQPCLIQWPGYFLNSFDSLSAKFKNKTGFTEVIIGSMNGKIYFLDLNSGKITRPFFDTKNPIKGSISISPGKNPLLATGTGIPYTSKAGMRIYDLQKHKLIYFRSGYDTFSFRRWPSFDSSPLFDTLNNQVFWPGENGLFYELNISDSFQIWENKYRYRIKGTSRLGIENSMAAYKNIGYFADNSGNLICIDLISLKPVWISKFGDDIDASPVIELEKNKPFIYAGCEVDLQGDKGVSRIRKIDALTGKTIWESKFPCYSIRGKRPSNGGMLATPICGKQKANNLLIIALARNETMRGGKIIALDKSTGKTVFTCQLKDYTWTSPLDIYDQDGNMYIFTADEGGNVYLINGENGTIIFTKNFGFNFESSPVSFGNLVVLGARGERIYCFEIH